MVLSPPLPGTQLETGHLLDEFPYVRASGGSDPLVVFPGVEDALFDGRYPRPVASLVRAYFYRYVTDRAVYIVSRPRGMPAGHAIGDMAEGYARVLDEVVGPADVLGISLGGLIAQVLARDRPDLVEKLVLASAGRRVADDGRDVLAEWQAEAAERDWSSLRADIVNRLYSDWRRFAYPPFVATAEGPLVPEPAHPRDVLLSVTEPRDFDSTDWLDEIEVPTLVVGGGRDPFYPGRILRETAEGLPDADLRVFPTARHGAFHERKLRFDTAVSTFLNR